MELPHKSGSAKVHTSLILMICTLISRVLGIIRVRLISTYFGASGIADIINFTFNIPNNFRKLLAEGAFSTAYIPILSKTIIEKKDKKESVKLVRMIITLQVIISLPICIVVTIFAKQTVLFLSNFRDVETLILSTNLIRYFIFYIVLVSLTAVVSSTLQCHNKFILAAISPLLFSSVVISSIIMFSEAYGPYAMAFGVLLGGLLQLVFLIPAFKRIGYSIVPYKNFQNPYFKQVIHNWFSVMGTSLVSMLTLQFAYYFASGMAEGSVTAFSNAIIFWQLPYGIFFSSIATVFFPAFSSSYNRKDFITLKKDIYQGIHYISVFIIPSMILLSGLAKPIIAVILQKGEFSFQNTLVTANVLSMFSIGILSVALFNYFQRILYAMQKIRPAFYLIVLVSLIDILLSLFGVLMKYSVPVLAIANTFSFSIGTIIIVIYTKKLIELPLLQILKNLLRILLANIPLVTSTVLFTYFNVDYWWIEGSTLKNFLLVLLLGFSGCLITILSYKLFNIDYLGFVKKSK